MPLRPPGKAGRAAQHRAARSWDEQGLWAGPAIGGLKTPEKREDPYSTRIMDISVKGKNLDVGEALRGHVRDTLGNAVTKYFMRAIDANVVFSRQGHRLRADISVHPGPRGLVVQGGSESEDAYAAFDGALERISKQLRRYKRRLNDHHKNKGRAEDVLPALQYVIQPEREEEEVPDDAQPTIVAEMPDHIHTLTVGEAVMRMDLADLPVVMFRNAASGRLNVVYRRNDGNIGWIDPSDDNKKNEKTKNKGK